MPHTKASLQQVKQDLVLCHKIIAHLGWDDLTYTHITARHPDHERFFILEFGYCFQEASLEKLVEVHFDGTVLETGRRINPTGYNIHASLYEQDATLGAIAHLHTANSIAVSTHPQGLLPLSQHALHLYNDIKCVDYDALTLHKERQGKALAEITQGYRAALLRNHGSLVKGKTLQEMLFFQYHLEKACNVQVQLNLKDALITPTQEACEQAKNDILAFEEALGTRDWEAFKRLVEG